MFRRIVTYLVCFCISFHPVPVYASNPDVTILRQSRAYAAQIGDKPVNCLDVKKGKSGQVHLAFDQSLHQENISYVLVLERQPIGQVFFEKGQLNFWGYQDHAFSLEAQEGYVYPLFCAQAVGDLFLTGGQFTKDSVFIAENLEASGIYKSTSALTFQARRNLNVQGQYATVQLYMQAFKLLLDAVAETTDIQAEAKIIEEAPTSKLYASNNIIVNGYQEGFSHKGMLKAKSAIVLSGDAYTGYTGSQTVAGSMFNNQSKTIDESGRVVAGLGYMQGTNLSLKDGFTFTGYHLVAESAGDLTLDPKAMIQVQYGAQLDAKKKLNHKGILSQVGTATINFPYMELFGLESFKPSSVQEHRQKAVEIQAVQAKTLPNVDLKGIALQSSQDMEISGQLMTPNNSITVKTPNLLFQGVSQSGFFEGLRTIIQSKTAIVEGVIRAHTVIAFIDQYVKLNGLMEAKHREIVFTQEEVKAKAAAELKATHEAEEKAKKEADAKAAADLKAKQEAEANAKLEADAQAAAALKAAQEAEAAQKAQQDAAAKAKAAADLKVKQEAEAAALKAKQEAEVKAQQEAADKAAADLKTKQEAEAKAAAALRAEKMAEYAATQEPKVFEMGSGANLIGGALSIQHADSAKLDAGVAKVTNLYIDAKETVQKAANELTIEQTAGFTGEVVKLGGSTQTKDLVATPAREVIVEKTGKVNASGKAQYKTKEMTVSGQAKADVSVTDVDKLVIPVGGDLQGNTNIVDAKDATADGLISGGVVQATFDNVTQGEHGSIKATQQAAINVKKEGTLSGKNDAPMMFLEGEKVTVASTGGVTGKEVIADVKQLTEEKGAVVVGSELTDIKSVDAKLDGETGSTVTNINVKKKLETGKDSKTKGTKQLVTNAKEWDHKGKTDAGHSFSKTEKTKIATGAEVNSTLSTQVQATKGFDNAGVIDTQGAAHLKTPSDKVGVVKTKKGLTLEPVKQPDVKGIFAGKHHNLKDNSSVTLIAKAPVTITESPKAPFGTGLVAPSININVPLNCQKDFELEATKTSMYLSHDIIGRGTVRIKAPSITVPKGKTMSANVLYAEATSGSIRNGGTMRGIKYLERRAAGDIVDEGYWSTRRNGKRSIPVWTPAQAIGGTGIPLKIGDKLCKVGLVSIAGGKIRNKGSHISTGAGADAYFDATYGIENVTEAQRYLAASWTKRHGIFKHKKTRYEEWSNVVGEAKEFIGGRMFRSSEKGGFFTSGSLHAGHGEDVTNVHGPVTYAAIILNNTVHISKKKFWGASKSSRHQETQQAKVVRFFNNGGIYHTSRTAGISGQGTQFVAPILVLNAPNKRIHFDEVLLNNSMHTKSSAFSPTISGIALFSDNGFGAMPGVSLYNDLRGMGQSDADIGRMVAGFQQTWSQISGLANGYNNGKFGQQILAQFGELGFSFTSSKSSQKWQTSVPTVMHVGVGHFISGKGVDLFGGAQVHASMSLKFETPELLLSASRLESSSKSKSFNCGAGYNPWTYTGSVNFGMNKTSSHGVRYEYAQLNAPVVDLGVMKILGLHGGAINCNKIHGKVGRVDVVTLQDEFHSKQSGFSVNLSSNFMSGISNPSGGFSFNVGSSHVKKANQHAGIFAAAGFDDSFRIDQLNVTDTELDPLLAAQAKHVSFTKIYDVKKSHSFGLGMQGLDLSSGEGFAQGFGKNAAVLVAGAAAAEFGKVVGLNDQVSAALAMAAGALVSNEINDYMGEDARAPASGIGNLGHLNYSIGDHKVNVTGIDFSLKNLKQAAQEIGLATEKFLAPEPVKFVAPVIPVIQVQELKAEPEILDEVSEEDGRPALRMKTPEDKVDVEDKAAEEKLAERKKAARQKAAAKKQASDKGKEEADADVLPPLGHFGLPKAARNLIENAPLILDEYQQSNASEKRAEERVEEKVHAKRQWLKDSPLGGFLDVMQKVSDYYADDDERAATIFRSGEHTLLEKWGVGLRVFDPEGHHTSLMSKVNASLGLSQFIIYGPEAAAHASEMISGYFRGLSPNEEMRAESKYLAQVIGMAALQLAGPQLAKRGGNKIAHLGTKGFQKLMDLRKNKQWTPLLDNSYANEWADLKYTTHRSVGLWMEGTIVTPDKIYGQRDHALSSSERMAQTYWKEVKNGYYILSGHGNTEGVSVSRMASKWPLRDFAPEILQNDPMQYSIKHEVVDHRILSRLIKSDSKYKRGQPVFLSACNVGNSTVPQHLANALGAPVVAPNGLLYNQVGVVWVGGHDSNKPALSYFYPQKPHSSSLEKFKQLLPEDVRKGQGLLKDDSGAVWIPSKGELKGYAKTFKNTVLNKLHEYQYKKHGWVPLVDNPRDGNWDEATVGKVVYLNEVGARFDNLRKRDDPKGPFTVAWVGSRRVSPEVGDDSGWSINPILFEQYLYAKGYKYGQPIAFVCCNSSESAKEVAEYMRVPVLGFNGFVRPNEDGGFKLIDRFSKQRLGYMETYYPRPSYQQAMIGAAGMAAGLAPVFMLTRDTQREDGDRDDFGDPSIGGVDERFMPFEYMH